MDGLATVLLRHPHRRPQGRQAPLQDRRQSHHERGRRQELQRRRRVRRHARGCARRLHRGGQPQTRVCRGRRRTVDFLRRREQVVKTDNLPISQFYHVSLDNADPYHVYGGLQDNSSWVGDSAYPGGITSARWENMFGGDGFWMFADPSDPDYVFAEYQGGNISRVNMRTHETRDLQPKLGAADLKRYTKLRFNWNTPIALSPHEPGTVYIGAQFLFRSRDHGQS